MSTIYTHCNNNIIVHNNESLTIAEHAITGISLLHSYHLSESPPNTTQDSELRLSAPRQDVPRPAYTRPMSSTCNLHLNRVSKCAGMHWSAKLEDLFPQLEYPL